MIKREIIQRERREREMIQRERRERERKREDIYTHTYIHAYIHTYMCVDDIYVYIQKERAHASETLKGLSEADYGD
jgi:hypothetical protein